jgi:hypothetical protein
VNKLVFSLLLSLLFWCRDAHSYSFTDDFQRGFYWSSLPIAISKFVVDSSDGPLLETLVREAESEWEAAVGHEVWSVSEGYQVGVPTSGNFIRWSHDFGNETGYDPGQTLAITTRRRVGTYIISTEIILNGNLPYLKSNWEDSLKKTILHEMGHSIGLGHSEVAAIMSGSINDLTALQQDDVDGFSALVVETLNRQITGYISPEAEEEGEETGALSCGSVDIQGPPSGNGPFSLVFGLLLLLFMPRARQNLPTD